MAEEAVARHPLISANWKMNLNHFEAIQTVQKLYWALKPEDYRAAEITLHVPFTDIRSVQTVLEADSVPIRLGAQNCHWEDAGAFTGEVSPAMLAKLNVAYVIVGHSERRREFNEPYDVIAKKAAAVVRNGMTPIVCVGEGMDDREAQRTEDKVRAQVLEAFSLLKADNIAKVVVAYEPAWAISTGKGNPVVATPEEAQVLCALIRSVVEEKWGAGVASLLRIQYGGSVASGNAAGLLRQPDIDGLLIGSASLDPDGFARLVAGVHE